MASVASPVADEFHAVVAGDPAVDRHAVFVRARAESPVFYSDLLDAYIVTKYDDVKHVLDDDEVFYSLTEGPGAPVYGRSLLQWRGREHNKKAGPVVRRIRSPKAFKEGLDDRVREITVGVADRVPFERQVDLKGEYTMWMPLLVITELLDVHEAGKFRDWYHVIAQGGISSINNPGAREKAFQALDEIREFIAPIVEERRAEPGSDVISDLTHATYDGEPFPFDEIVATVVFLLTAGVETTERLLASLFRYLALNPEMWDEVRARRDDREFLIALSAEALRMFPPVQALTRITHEPVEIRGVRIEAGKRVLPFLVSANRDEDHWPDPHRFDMERFAGRGERQFTNAGEILSFGAGRHHCAGSRLAGMESIHGIRELAERVVRIDPAVDPLPVSTGFMLHSPAELPVILHAA